jgi:hypothetical protein
LSVVKIRAEMRERPGGRGYYPREAALAACAKRETPRPATATKPTPPSAPPGPRHYPPKPCARCGAEFNPTGPNTKRCRPCAAIVRREHDGARGQRERAPSGSVPTALPAAGSPSLEARIVAWAEAQWPDTPVERKFRKLCEEVGELGEALVKLAYRGGGRAAPGPRQAQAVAAAVSEAGDCAIVLAHLLWMLGERDLVGVMERVFEARVAREGGAA